MKTGTLLMISLIMLQGCSKSSSGEKDNTAPVIIINSPVSGQIFTAGQTIQISGNITDNQYIAEVHIHVYNNNSGSLLMDVHLYPASNSFGFNQSINAAAGINYQIQVIARDRAVNETSTSVYVSCN